MHEAMHMHSTSAFVNLRCALISRTRGINIKYSPSYFLGRLRRSCWPSKELPFLVPLSYGGVHAKIGALSCRRLSSAKIAGLTPVDALCSGERQMINVARSPVV